MYFSNSEWNKLKEFQKKCDCLNICKFKRIKNVEYLINYDDDEINVIYFNNQIIVNNDDFISFWNDCNIPEDKEITEILKKLKEG